MNCDDVDDLLGAYALDALPAGDAASVRAHLMTCAEHRRLAAELRAVAAALPELVDPIDPPAVLRTRVLAAVDREARIPAIAITANRRPNPAYALGLPAYAWGAVAAVLVLAVAGLVGWNVVLQSRLNGRDDAARFATRVTWTAPLRSATGADAHGTVIYFGDERKAMVIGDSLPPLDASKTYQLWSVGEGNPVSLGLMAVGTDGHGMSVAPYDARAATMIAITVEPAGGSAQPTSQPVFTAKA